MTHATTKTTAGSDFNAALSAGTLMPVMVPAASVRVGDAVVERDGAFFRVTSIRDTGRSFVFTLANDAGYMLAATHAKVSKRSNVRVLAVSL